MPTTAMTQPDSPPTPRDSSTEPVAGAVALPGPAALKQWLRDMMLIREFEVRSMQAYQNKLAGGFMHVYNGQEAIAVGCVAALQADDPIITAYRDHGHALARGLAPDVAMAELFGRIGGCAKGKGGSMHFFDAEHHMYGGHGIVGAQIPLGAGLAFATKYRDEVMDGKPNSRVTLAFMGDGALNQGSVHEAMNLASVLDLPVIFIVENNFYAMGTAIERCTAAGGHIAERAKAYDMDAATLEGMDVLDVYRGMKPLIDRCRETSRPCFVDMRCYRFKGHSMSDPRKYRTHEEEEQWEDCDPIERLAAHLVDQDHMTGEAFKALGKEIRAEIRVAVKSAEASPEPPLSELYHDVYADSWGPYTGTSVPEFMRRRKGDRGQGNA
ncbi:MAG: pyruvate dehydrogenase (acetyl-transferring) E1 component subunit alpha [Phycisphaerales bacterium]|nr:pyruvate dehydrogenase (acetyl-transferring) E1 component subunit alpha [Phycisphaerales bacterium]